MGVVLEAPFATVQDTARELGVSKARVKRLMRLLEPADDTRANGHYAEYRAKKTQKSLATAKRRKKARAKAKRVAR